jgi:hypothetical protein
MKEEQFFKGRDVAKEAREIGTDGGWSDYQLRGIKAHSYRLEEIPVAEILGADPDLAAYVNAGQLRRFEGKSNLDFAPIILKTGEVLDGYNRILQHVRNGTERIYVYRAAEETREFIKGGNMEISKEQREILGDTYEVKKAEAEALIDPEKAKTWYQENAQKRDEVTLDKMVLLEELSAGGDKETFIHDWILVEVPAAENKEKFQAEHASAAAADKDIAIRNEFLLKSVENDPEQKQKYTALMEKATKGLKEATDLTLSEKKRIATELNSECAAGVFRHWGKAADVVYAGICMEKGGDPYLHEKYTRPDNRPYVDEEFKVSNKHLMDQVEGLPDLERKYMAAQEALSKEVFYSKITYSDKKKIVDSLNSEAGAKLIANHSAQAEIVVYAGLCLADGGAAALEKYPIPEEVKSQSLAAGKVVGRLKSKAADMGI